MLLLCVAFLVLIGIILMSTKVSSISGGTSYPKSLPDSKKQLWDRKELQVNQLLQDIYKDQAVYTEDNEKIKYTSGVNPAEGYFLYKLTKDNNLENVLEVGMANGTSALYICQAMKENKSGTLISVDPFQSTQWRSIGMLNIKRAKLQDHHELMETTSDLALPELLKEQREFDMIFVDGMHLFDYTLLDIYYAAKLLKKGGILVVDDIKHRGVKKAIDYISRNYTFLKRVASTMASATMGMFIKEKEDTRLWNFHEDF